MALSPSKVITLSATLRTLLFSSLLICFQSSDFLLVKLTKLCVLYFFIHSVKNRRINKSQDKRVFNFELSMLQTINIYIKSKTHSFGDHEISRTAERILMKRIYRFLLGPGRPLRNGTKQFNPLRDPGA